MFFVYFLQSVRNNKYYTGLTEKNPKIRVKEHNSGTNKWTRENGPFELVYFESYFCKRDAEEREKFYKSGFGRNELKDISSCYFASDCCQLRAKNGLLLVTKP